MLKTILVAAALAVFIPAFHGTAIAGSADGKDVYKSSVADVDLFHTGRFEFQALDGALFSQQPTHDARPNFDYEITVLRLGYMLDTPRGHGFFRGNDEVIFEGQGSVLFQGPGTAMGGASFMYRRNFVQPGSLVIPYISGGLGGLYDDIYHSFPQRAIGARFQFNLQAGIGLRFLLGRHSRFAVDAEASYRHISDASLTERNDGIDSVGGELGFSMFF